MRIGIIIKGVGGLYQVSTDEGIVVCHARGRFRLDKTSPLVGDSVEITDAGDGEGYLHSILPRRNELVRPPLANIDALAIVVSAAPPRTDCLLIDKMCAIAAYKNVQVIVCINKNDLNIGEDLVRIYSQAGYDVLTMSAETGEGIEALKYRLKDKITVFAGNSGVGKSSILNRLNPCFNLKTAEISLKIGRGRHTTRHVEIYKLDTGGYVADTPGFSSFDTKLMDMLDKTQLQYTFIEFEKFLGQCRFANCSHTKEKDCAVRSAVEAGIISTSRYDSYSKLYEGIKDIKEWELK